MGEQGRLGRRPVPAAATPAAAGTLFRTADPRQHGRAGTIQLWPNEARNRYRPAGIGKFAVRSAAGILPDGTPFSIPDGADHASPLDLPETLRNAIIYLALPARQPGSIETAPADRLETGARFAIAEHEAIDTNAGYQSLATVPIGRLRLRYALERTAGRGTSHLDWPECSKCAPTAR